MVAADARTAPILPPSPGQIRDAPEGRRLPSHPDPRRNNPSPVMDRAHEGNKTEHLTLDLGFMPVVPLPRTRIDPSEYDREIRRRSNGVEHIFRRPEDFPRIFYRFEKLGFLFLGFILFTLTCDAIR